MLLVAAAPANAPRYAREVTVAASGTTRIAAMLGGNAVSADIVTRIAPQTGRGETLVTACTGGRAVCSPVSQIHLRVGTEDLLVPHSLVLRLGDVNRMKLREVNPGRFELLLECGDASEAYDAHVLFNRRRVTELDIVDGETNMLAERTTYADLSHAFDD